MTTVFIAIASIAAVLIVFTAVMIKFCYQKYQAYQTDSAEVSQLESQFAFNVTRKLLT